MDFTYYLERWSWLGLTLLVFALLSPSARLGRGHAARANHR